jgi:hypothetical protein
MVRALGYLLRVGSTTATQPPKTRNTRRRATGMASRTRDLRRVKTATVPAEKFAPNGADTVARIIAAGGDPNAPHDADSLALIASRAFARVLSEMTGEAWVAA